MGRVRLQPGEFSGCAVNVGYKATFVLVFLHPISIVTENQKSVCNFTKDYICSEFPVARPVYFAAQEDHGEHDDHDHGDDVLFNGDVEDEAGGL